MDEWLPLQMALALLRASLGFRQPSVSGYTFACGPRLGRYSVGHHLLGATQTSGT